MAPLNLLRNSIRQSLHPRPIRTSATLQTRVFSKTSFAAFPRKDSQDKDSINTEATEYTKSGTDDASARQEEAAFDPKNTDPQKEKDIAGDGNEKSGNPLDVSPANPGVSEQSQEGDTKSTGTGKRSGGGSPPKAGK